MVFLSSFKAIRYRDGLSLPRLGRANLVTGTNGKTALIEAIWLFTGRPNPGLPWNGNPVIDPVAMLAADSLGTPRHGARMPPRMENDLPARRGNSAGGKLRRTPSTIPRHWPAPHLDRRRRNQQLGGTNAKRRRGCSTLYAIGAQASWRDRRHLVAARNARRAHAALLRHGQRRSQAGDERGPGSGSAQTPGFGNPRGQNRKTLYLDNEQPAAALSDCSGCAWAFSRLATA